MLFESTLKFDFFRCEEKNVLKWKISYFVEEFYILRSSSGAIQHGRHPKSDVLPASTITTDALSRYKYISMVITCFE